ncbi:PaaI family thioesterase [Pseudahrensia aquimaris]|uniref:PaaI family thioesterase n=1 Tax=Pseudahrensia aquimaris TaxID=744461 RepID=A0ABW3FFP4_9HYPH
MQKPVFTPEELNAYIAEVYPEIIDQLPQYNVRTIEAGRVVVESKTDHRHIRAGGTVSGPTLFAIADMGGYCCALSVLGREALTVTTNLNINFMRKAEPGLLVADSRILKMGKRLMVFDCTITKDGKTDIIAHATGTYAIPPK